MSAVRWTVSQKVRCLLTTNGGIAAQVASQIWQDTSLTLFERSLAAPMWTNCLWMLARRAARQCQTQPAHCAIKLRGLPSTVQVSAERTRSSM